MKRTYLNYTPAPEGEDDYSQVLREEKNANTFANFYRPIYRLLPRAVQSRLYYRAGSDNPPSEEELIEVAKANGVEMDFTQVIQAQLKKQEDYYNKYDGGIENFCKRYGGTPDDYMTKRIVKEV